MVRFNETQNEIFEVVEKRSTERIEIVAKVEFVKWSKLQKKIKRA